MTQDGDEGIPESIDGLPISDAVEAVLARNEDRDPEAVRRALYHVSEDGVVREDAVDDALAQASKVVSTPETRVELAAMDLAEAREAAEPVADLAVVESQLDAFRDRLSAAEDRVADLGPELRRLVERGEDADGIYDVARGVQRLTEDANAAQIAADDLRLDLEHFERWVGSPSRRLRELGEDVDALVDYRTEIDETADDLAAAADEMTDPAVAWCDATLRQRVLGLLLADLWAELADLRTWADREDDDDGRAAQIEARLDDLEEGRSTTGDRLADVARPAWNDRFGALIADFETALDAFEPPVEWGVVQATLDEHLPENRGGP